MNQYAGKGNDDAHFDPGGGAAGGWRGRLGAGKAKKQAVETSNDSQVVYLSDDEAVIDAQPQALPATVKNCFRRMNPLTLEAANEAVFLLEDGAEIKLNFAGEGGLHIKPGDHGLLTWRGMKLIRFEMDNGDVIGGVFYMPAQEEASNE